MSFIWCSLLVNGEVLRFVEKTSHHPVAHVNNFSLGIRRDHGKPSRAQQRVGTWSSHQRPQQTSIPRRFKQWTLWLFLCLWQKKTGVSHRDAWRLWSCDCGRCFLGTALTWTKLSTRTSARPKKSTAAGLRMAPTEAGSRALPCHDQWSGIEVDEGKEVSSGRNTVWHQLPVG